MSITWIAARPATTDFPDREAARRALIGPQGQAANRFFRGATSKSVNFRIAPVSDDVLRLEYFSPARNPGYGKRYIQEVDGEGNVIREYKETWGPEGIIETKWVHGGPE